MCVCVCMTAFLKIHSMRAFAELHILWRTLFPTQSSNRGHLWSSDTIFALDELFFHQGLKIKPGDPPIDPHPWSYYRLIVVDLHLGKWLGGWHIIIIMAVTMAIDLMMTRLWLYQLVIIHRMIYYIYFLSLECLHYQKEWLGYQSNSIHYFNIFQ